MDEEIDAPGLDHESSDTMQGRDLPAEKTLEPDSEGGDRPQRGRRPPPAWRGQVKVATAVTVQLSTDKQSAPPAKKPK
jgi:hypothetical protein